MSCPSERVSAWVDGELSEPEARELAGHVEACVECREQAADERVLRARLRALPPVVPRPELEAAVRWRLAQARTRPRRLTTLFALAASLVLAVVWARSTPGVLARELAFDHAKCFSLEELPAAVWSGEGSVIERWLAGEGGVAPELPDRVGELSVVGARFCPLLGLTHAAHVYYASGERHASLFVVDRLVWLGDGWAGRALGRAVRLQRFSDGVVGIVADSDDDVEALRRAFHTLSVDTRLTAR